jgi:hypothetical protein
MMYTYAELNRFDAACTECVFQLITGACMQAPASDVTLYSPPLACIRLRVCMHRQVELMKMNKLLFNNRSDCRATSPPAARRADLPPGALKPLIILLSTDDIHFLNDFAIFKYAK